MMWMLLLAQTTQTATQPAGRPPSILDPGFLGLMLAFGVFIYFVMIRPQQKERQRHRSMLDALKRNDRVQTIGGIIGTVVEVRDHEVVLKVDENSNVKMRFIRGAIKEVLREPAPAATETREAPRK
jgi:preprotein translocase subunit YajC